MGRVHAPLPRKVECVALGMGWPPRRRSSEKEGKSVKQKLGPVRANTGRQEAEKATSGKADTMVDGRKGWADHEHFACAMMIRATNQR